jgi:PAS domain S-box-containing protein
MEAYRLGAVDYLVKPLVPEILRAKVNGFVELFQKTEQVRRQAERIQALERQESEERYRDLFENANDAIYTLDMERRITSVNRRAEEVLGFPRAELIGRDAAAVVPAEYHPIMIRALEQKLAGDSAPTVYELEIVRKDGRRLRLEISSRLIMRAGKPIGIQGIARDITERKQAEDALRRSEERLRLAQQGARIGTFEWEVQANRNVWSPELSTLYGLESEQFEGTFEAWVERVHRDDRAVAEAAVRRALETGQCAVDFRVVWPDGSIRWLHARAVAVREPNGAPIRLVGVNVDITERKLAEEALREEDRRKDEFLALLAHQLRNPLAPMRYSLHLLRQRSGSRQTVEQVHDQLEKQVRHLTRLVDELLDVSCIAGSQGTRMPEQGNSSFPGHPKMDDPSVPLPRTTPDPQEP